MPTDNDWTKLHQGQYTDVYHYGIDGRYIKQSIVEELCRDIVDTWDRDVVDSSGWIVAKSEKEKEQYLSEVFRKYGIDLTTPKRA